MTILHQAMCMAVMLTMLLLTELLCNSSPTIAPRSITLKTVMQYFSIGYNKQDPLSGWPRGFNISALALTMPLDKTTG